MSLKVNNQKLAVFHYFATVGAMTFFYTRIGMIDFRGYFNKNNRKYL